MFFPVHSLTLSAAWAMFFLYKRYRALKGRGAKARSSMDFSMPIRILAFGLYLASALRFVGFPIPRQLEVNSPVTTSLSLTSIQAPESPIPDLMIATGLLRKTYALIDTYVP